MAKKALCLSGGATRGSFQMGAIKCLYEVWGFRPDIIAATSVGAVNGIKLACAPPPAVNDSEAILTQVLAGNIDPQLKHMRELEQFWLGVNGRKDFFAIRPPFRGTMIESALDENSSFGLDDDAILWANIGMYFPLTHVISGIAASAKLKEIESLMKNVQRENAVADLSPVSAKLRDPKNINTGMAGDMPPYTNNLFNGTPLYQATISLETGKLRFVTNKGEFYERDGVTPVATALLDADIDAALDENLQPLAQARRDNIKLAVSKYKAAVNAMASYLPELKDDGTAVRRKKALAAAMERERERGIYWARAAAQQIRGLRIKAVVRDANGAPDPVTGAVASCSLPALLEPPEIGVERYVDAGMRELIPIDIVLDQNVTQIVGILCSTPSVPEADSKKNVGLIEVALRALTEIAIHEIGEGDLVGAAHSGIDTRIIAPTVDVHSGMDLKPSLIEISMHYGWMRAEDEMQPVTAAAEREIFRQTSELVTRLRMRCLDLERQVQQENILNVGALMQGYFELRVNRWAILHVAARRQALGLPPHPAQASWSMEWERESRGGPTIWAKLESRSIDGAFQADLWPASSPSTFNPDVGTLEDAGSDRIYWMVRGAIFEDRSGAPPDDPFRNVVVPNGLHQFLPRIPTGAHLMAETQDQAAIFLVIGGKKYAAPTAAWIAAAGLTGSTAAIVPQGGLAQIPDGTVPYFLGTLTVVDANYAPLAEVTLERLEQSTTTADIRIRNRSTATLTNVAITTPGFPASAGITLDYAPTSVTPNSIDLVILRLQPTAAGEFNGAIRIDSSDPVVPQVIVPLKLRVLPLGGIADLQVTPSPLSITAPVNSTASYSMLTVTNVGPVVPARIAATFEPASVEGLFNTGQHLLPGSLTTGAARPLSVFFYPTVAGTFNGELVLTASGLTSLNNPYTRSVRVPLTGTAVASKISLLTQVPTPADLQSLTAHGVVTVDLGTVQPPVADALTVYLLNLGSLPLEITDLAGYYVTPVGTQTLPIVIAPNQWTEVHFDLGTWRALGIGRFSETLRILSNDPVTPTAEVVVNGLVAGTKGRIAPEYVNFGFVPANTAVQRTVEFRNEGSLDLHVTRIAWQSGVDFRLAPQPMLPATVSAGAGLALQVEFGPATTTGAYNDYLVLRTREGVAANLAVQARV
jgi:hypothetical protein